MQCGHSQYSIIPLLQITPRVYIAKCGDCGIQGFYDTLFTPFITDPRVCPHPGNFFNAGPEEYCIDCGVPGVHDTTLGFTPHGQMRKLRVPDPGLDATIRFADEGGPVPLPEPPKRNPENPLGCECGAWVVGQNQYGQGHDGFCKLRRD